MMHHAVGFAVSLGLTLGACSKKDETKEPPAATAPAVVNLPYFGSTPVAPGVEIKTGVEVLDPSRVDPSYRLIAFGKQPVALLLAPDGTVAHRWQVEQSPVSDLLADDVSEGWQNVELFPNGDLLALRVGLSLARISPRSEVRWIKEGPYHHESHIEDGKIYTLTEHYRVTDEATHRGVLDSNIVVLDEQGEPVGTPISLYEALTADPELAAYIGKVQAKRYDSMPKGGPVAAIEFHLRKTEDSVKNAPLNRVAARMRKMVASPEYRAALEEAFATGTNKDRPLAETAMLLRTIPGNPLDILHANSVVPLPAHPDGLWEKGDYLVSLRELDLLAVISHKQRKAIWSWGAGVLDGQHEATYLEDGKILVFDNGERRRWSRVLEIDPVSETIVWSHGSNERTAKFLSLVAGGVHKLPNGNALINVTLFNRILEVTRDGATVWLYRLPLNDAGTEQFTTYRCNSVSPEVAAAVLAAK